MSAQEGTGQGDLRHHCACPGVGPSACIPSGQAGSPCTPGFPITQLGCLGESHAWFHVPLSASPYQKGGGGWGHSPVTQPPAVASPPAPAHVVLVLALVPAPSSSRLRCPSAIGWGGAGGAASPRQLPRGWGWSRAGGVCSGLAAASRAGAVSAGAAPGSALGVSGPAGNRDEKIIGVHFCVLVGVGAGWKGCRAATGTAFARLKPVIAHCFGGFP